MPPENLNLIAEFRSNKEIEIVDVSSQYPSKFCTKGKDFGDTITISQSIINSVILYIPGNGPEISTTGGMGSYSVSIYYSPTFDGNYTLVGSATTTQTGATKYTITPYKVSNGAGYYKFSIQSGLPVTVSSPEKDFRITSNCR